MWIQHLPRVGSASYAAVVAGDEVTLDLDERRMSPLLRALVAANARLGPRSLALDVEIEARHRCAKGLIRY